MIAVELLIRKSEVYDEVALTTAYVGKKMLSKDDQGAYERIFTTDSDRLQLERFWSEASSEASNLLKPFVEDLSPQPDSDGVDLSRDYLVRLSLPQGYDPQLNTSMSSSLHSFFVEMLCAKWFRVANKPEAEEYHRSALKQLGQVEAILYHRKRPKRKRIDASHQHP